MLVAGCGGGDEDSPAERAAEAAIDVDDGAGGAGGGVAGQPVVSWTRSAAELVFMSNRGGNADIYLMHGNDTTRVNLTRSEADDNWPVWSPDGSRIVFQRAVGIGETPEDTRTALDIFVMNADGSGVTRLTSHPADDYLPSWSPDGTRITFTSWRQEPADSIPVKGRLPRPANHIYIMNADGSDPRRFFPDSPGMSAGVVWAPGGDALVMARSTNPDARSHDARGRGADIFLVSPDGIVIRRLTRDDATNGAPTFSPDGRWVAYHADHGDHSEIVVVDRWGLGRQVVVAAGKNWYPRWSPDGKWLVYTSAGDDGTLDVMAVPAAGGDPVIVAGGPDRESEGSWRPR
jgi:TolB protein